MAPVGQVVRLIKKERREFFKALFLCLLLMRLFSVDRLLQASGDAVDGIV
jgi:hypothetical protein